MSAIKRLFTIFVLAWCGLDAYSVNLPPRISLSIPAEALVEGRDIPLYITIDHMEGEAVDENSFLLDGKMLKVESIRVEKVAPKQLYQGADEEALIVSKYRASLPKRTAGVYEIGPVSVVVGGARYNSDTLTVNVQAAVVSKDFRLEGKIEAPPKIFPGQEVVFQYKIFFKGSMQLLREELPMLNVAGFIMTGSPEITTEKSGEGYVQSIRQRAKATTPGTYEIGVSTIEGMAVQGGQERAILIPPLYRAQVPSSTIAILPFPTTKRPSFFDGALGSFIWRASVANGSTVQVGEPVRIEYRVSGRGDLATVQFPSFDRLRGLTDSFWTEATPPVGEEEDGTKSFMLVIRPKRLGEIEVPGFFTASFDPYSEQYLTATVPPVKLKVEGTKEEEEELSKKAPVVQRALAPPFEIDASTVQEHYLSPVWIAIAFIAAIIGGVIQRIAYASLTHAKEKKVTSKDLFYSAVKNRGKREMGLQLLQKAFFLKLYEMGMTQKVVDSPDEIVGEGVVGEVKVLLQAIDRQLYKAGEPKANLQEIYDEASALYYRLKQIPVPAAEKGEGER